ncbi:MAG: lipopolysaccharide biosynthesis protein [Saprospiraceae bacterium]|nr:lipopolysaccharide biosynthesis protein [Saprospiraceae bacterium]
MPLQAPQSELTDPLEHAYRRSVRWSMAGAAGAAIFQFLQMIFFARFATAAELGDYALAAVVIGFLAPVAEAGVSQAIVIADGHNRSQLAALAWVNFSIGLLIFLLLFVAADFFAGWYDRPVLSDILVLMGTTLLIAPFGVQSSGLLTRAMRFDAAAKVEVISWACSFITVAILAWRGWGPWSMAAGYVLRNAVATMGSMTAAWPGLSFKIPDSGDLRDAGPLLRFGFFELSSRWADFLSNYLDKLVVGKWLGVTALGYYNLAFTLFMMPTGRLGYVITRVSFPVFARVRDDKPRLEQYFRQINRQIVVLLFPLYAGMMLFHEEIVLLLFGQSWLPAAPLLIAFGLAGLVRSCNAVLPQLIKGMGKPSLLLGWMLVWTAVLNIFLVSALAISPSAISAAWGRVAAKYCIEIAMLWWLARRCGLAFAPVLKFAARVVAWLAPVAAICWLAGQIPGNFWLVFAAKAVVFGSGIYLLAFKSPLRDAFSACFRLFHFERQPR